jgi:hypothetical protein
MFLSSPLAQVGEFDVELVPDLAVGVPRDADSAGLSQRLQSRRHVDPVAVEIVVLDDHVADVDADPEGDPPIFGDRLVTFRHLALDVDGESYRVDHAGELHQRPVAH